jgi:hypothetical protein
VTTGLLTIMEAIANSLDPLTTTVDGLQVVAGINPSPTPPSLDVYPAPVSMEPASFEGWEETFIVRARVSTPDDFAAQEVLWGLMDVDGDTSVMGALHDGGFVVDERTGPTSYPGDYLGCEWRVRTIQ